MGVNEKESQETPEQSKISAVKMHMQATHDFYFPRWALYLIATVVALVLCFGAVQQFRIWRYSRILRASKIRITELDSKVQTAKLEGMREVASKQHKINKEEIKKIDAEIKKQEAKQQELKKGIDHMKPSDLLRSFQEEGF